MPVLHVLMILYKIFLIVYVYAHVVINFVRLMTKEFHYWDGHTCGFLINTVASMYLAHKLECAHVHVCVL